MNIDGRCIVVTGASRGIGLATAQALSGKGAKIAMLARSGDVLEAAASIAPRKGIAKGYTVDVTDPKALDETGRQIQRDLGEPHILINNAGLGQWLSCEETAPEDAEAMMAAPYFAAFHATRTFLPAMSARRSGMIVNINSPAGWMPWPGATGYTAARWAMRGFTAALRADLMGTGIRILEVVPGKVSSSYFESNPNSEERLPRITRMIPTLTPERVADAVVYGIERDRRTIFLPFMLKLALAGNAIAPAMARWMMHRTGWKHPAAGQGGP